MFQVLSLLKLVFLPLLPIVGLNRICGRIYKSLESKPSRRIRFSPSARNKELVLYRYSLFLAMRNKLLKPKLTQPCRKASHQLDPY